MPTKCGGCLGLWFRCHGPCLSPLPLLPTCSSVMMSRFWKEDSWAAGRILVAALAGAEATRGAATAAPAPAGTWRCNDGQHRVHFFFVRHGQPSGLMD